MWSRLRKGADHVAGRVPLLASGSDSYRVLEDSHGFEEKKMLSGRKRALLGQTVSVVAGCCTASERVGMKRRAAERDPKG